MKKIWSKPMIGELMFTKEEQTIYYNRLILMEQLENARNFVIPKFERDPSGRGGLPTFEDWKKGAPCL